MRVSLNSLSLAQVKEVTGQRETVKTRDFFVGLLMDDRETSF